MSEWIGSGRIARMIVGTPCFLVSERRVHSAWRALRDLESGLPLRHWLSLKTQPIPRLIEVARDWDIGVEVVSEFELTAVMASEIPPSAILVNGLAKQHWLPRYGVAGLTVHFDSLAEVRALAGMARALAWRVGLRCAIPESADGIAPVWDQFGMIAEEVPVAGTILAGAGVPVSGVHFHLDTSIAHASRYRRALEHLQQVCALGRLEPKYLDIGGGLPIAGEHPWDGPAAASTFELHEFREVLRSIPDSFPSVHEVWLENGRS